MTTDQLEFAILPPAPRSLDPLPTLRERYLAAIQNGHYPWARRHPRNRFTEYDQFRAIWQDELWHWLYGDNPRGIGSLTQFAWKVQHARLSEGGYKSTCLNWSDRNQRLYLGDGLLDYLGLLKDEVERLYGFDETDLRRARDAVANSLLHPPCPHDTNGDGDCGRPLCPVCHPFTSTGP